MRYRLVPILIVAVVLAAVLAAVTANPVNGFPSRARACTDCHPAAPASATVTATPSTATPAAGAAYSVTITLAGFTAGGNSGYWISATPATVGSGVWGGDVNAATTFTQTMTAPSSPGTYSYTVWVSKGSQSSGQAKSTTYAITVPAPPAGTSAITGVTPNHAQNGASVVIAGANLGTGGVVRFGTTAAATTAWNATSVTVTVPASLAAGATTVSVTPTGAAASNTLAFTVDAPSAPAPAPALSAVAPSSGLAGSALTLTGANLGTSGTVTIGGIAAATGAWSTTSITATVPASLTAGAKSVTVTTGGQTSNAVTFTVTAPSVPVPAPTSAADMVRPTTKALCPSRVKRHKIATLKYQVDDPTPNGGWADVTIRIKDRRGKVVKVLALGKQTVNVPLKDRFKCGLGAGTYRFSVKATDAAGNRQARIGRQTLTVIR